MTVMPRELAVILCIMFTCGTRLISCSQSTSTSLLPLLLLLCRWEMQDSENLTELSEVFVKGLRTRIVSVCNINIHVSSSYLGLVFSMLLNMKDPQSLLEKVQLNSPYFPFFHLFSPKQLPTSHMYLYIYHLSPTLGESSSFSHLFIAVSPAWKVPGRCKLVLNECAHA